MDKVTDMAGRFPIGDANSGRHMSRIADRTQFDTETHRRIYKELADQISKLVKSDGIEGWSFAAPAEFHSAIVDLLPNEVRNRIVEHVKSDLVKVESAKLTNHFRSLRPV